MSTPSPITEFFSSSDQKFAVVGASSNRTKFGNKVLRWYTDHGYTAVPVNPKEKTIESLACVPNLSSLPGSPSEYHVSIITPPAVTKSVLEEAHKNGIQRVWLQPDVDSPEALAYAKEVGIHVIAGGPCVLVHGITSEQAKL
ncbi:CoA-binding protein [Gamsiella multidivaricata]|uniref:CoA-binding protein n=1 Tax=Gamsiella multidivaricata TaxID=101098 RepID=UPI0022201CE9|nr:CoA-binding protein [Gamsiella multidivaricata]KAI7831203.1 CoA-binding protein [Gamsiella multidivaricata]